MSACADGVAEDWIPMEALKTPRKRRLVDTAAGPKALVLVGSEWIEMEVSKLGRSNFFLSSETYIPPRAVLEVKLVLPKSKTPILMRVSTSFIDRTADGYGVGAELSSLSTDDKKRWEEFLSKVSALMAATVKSGVRGSRSGSSARKKSATVVGDVLSEPTLTMLTRMRVEIERVATLAEAVAKVEAGTVKMVISDLQAAKQAGPAVYERLRAHSDTVAWAALTDRTAASDFEDAVAMGVGMAIGTPCSQKLLILRLLDLYRRSHVTESSTNLPPVSADPKPAKPSKESDAAPAVLEKLTRWLRPGR